jgi:hypothetical protein
MNKNHCLESGLDRFYDSQLVLLFFLVIATLQANFKDLSVGKLIVPRSEQPTTQQMQTIFNESFKNLFLRFFYVCF